ncbi:MAG: MFS transporter, partial [Spirochaetota bacterium]
AQTEGFLSPLVLGLLGLSIISLVVFILIEKRTAEPIILIDLFRNRVFSINLILLLISMIALNGYGFLMPFYMQNVLQLSTIQMGITLAIVFGLVMAVTAPIGGTISDKIGAAKVTMIGIFLLFASTIGAIWLNETSTQLSVLLHFLPIGIGIGLIITPTTSAIMGAMPRNRLGMGSSLVSISINMAQTMGIAILGSYWSSRVNTFLGYPPSGGASTAPANMQANALQETFILAACLLGIGLILNLWELISLSRRADRKSDIAQNKS